jgi:hypothetical protein
MQTKQTHYIYKFEKIIFSATTVILGCFLILYAQEAFSGEVGAYAKVKSSTEVEFQVKTNKLPIEYRYYYTGRSSLPYAIIGIDPKYTLKGKYWYQIKSLDKVIHKINNLMPIVQATDITYSKILDTDGNHLGIWFSEYPHVVVRFESGNNLTVFSPYRPNDDV